MVVDRVTSQRRYQSFCSKLELLSQNNKSLMIIKDDAFIRLDSKSALTVIHGEMVFF